MEFIDGLMLIGQFVAKKPVLLVLLLVAMAVETWILATLFQMVDEYESPLAD